MIGDLIREIVFQCGESERPCKFDKMMRRVNGLGPDWVLSNIDAVVKWIYNESMNRGLDFDSATAAGLVRLAVRRHAEHESGRVATSTARRKKPATQGKARTAKG